MGVRARSEKLMFAKGMMFMMSISMNGMHLRNVSSSSSLLNSLEQTSCMQMLVSFWLM